MAKSLKIDTALWQRLEAHAADAGYSSPEEYVTHLIEQELSRLEAEHAEASAEAERRLRGLGYLA
jgi:hypothetical protein